MNNFLCRYTISRYFYESLRETYPLAFTEDIGLALHEMFTTWRDNSDNAVVPYETLAQIYDKEQQAKRKNFKAKQALQRFAEAVEPFEEFGYDRRTGVARRIKIIWPEKIQQLLADELDRKFEWSGRVFYDGTPFTEEQQEKNLNRKRREALKTLSEADNILTKKTLNYFNKIPNTLFIGTLKHYDQAFELANTLSNSLEIRRVLRQIYDEPKPFIKAVKNSTRAYPIGENLVTVKSEIRHILTQDWIEADLKNCQLAIAAHKWKVESVQEFLSTGQSFWPYLAEWVGVELTQSNKDMLKRATYAVLYGASNRGNRNKIREALWYLGKAKYKRLMESPLIQALYKAAKSQLKEIEKKGGAQTYLGNWISLDDVEVSADWKDPKKSLLAQVNQSYEAMLLYPALELAIRHQKDEDGFYLSLYQYDGISIMAKQPEKIEYWATKVKEAVDENAKWCGINTTLEFVQPTKPKNL
jgi:hypothetical protein